MPTKDTVAVRLLPVFTAAPATVTGWTVALARGRDRSPLDMSSRITIPIAIADRRCTSTIEISNQLAYIKVPDKICSEHSRNRTGTKLRTLRCCPLHHMPDSARENRTPASCMASRHHATRPVPTGTAGIEPTNRGLKARCRTIWLRAHAGSRTCTDNHSVNGREHRSCAMPASYHSTQAIFKPFDWPMPPAYLSHFVKSTSILTTVQVNVSPSVLLNF